MIIPRCGVFFLIGCALLLSSSPSARGVDYFPLEKGNYWIYRGETKFLVNSPATKTNEAKSVVLTWKMEVVATASRDRLFAALIKGAPFDLSWYEPGKTRGTYLIVRAGIAAYYLFSGDSAREAWTQIKGNAPSLGKLGLGRGLLIDAPLVEGKVFGGELMNQARGRYCWVVEGERAFRPKRFPSPEKLVNPRAFTLSFRTSPDHQTLDFVPGLGIVGFQFKHHGTLSETDLSLISFSRSSRPGR